MSVVGIGFLLIASVVAYSFFGDTVDKIFTTLAEQQQQQNDQAQPEEKDSGNLASDTNTRVCNLELKFVGTVFDPVILGNPFTTQELELGMGTPNPVFDLVNSPNKNIIEYRWLCTGENATASWLELMSFYNTDKLTELSLTGSGQIEEKDRTIRLFFSATSMNNGKDMFAGTSSSGDRVNEFSDKIVLKQGTKLPSAFELPVFLYDVTEDDYYVEFYSKDLKINSKMPNSTFKYNLCSPTKTSCG